MSQIRPLAQPSRVPEVIKTVLAAVPTLLAVLGPPTVLRAYMVFLLWQAYLQPMGAPALRLVNAFGIVLIIEALGIRRPQRQSKPLLELYVERVIEAFIVLTLGLAGLAFI
jgi:hypothetical protein